MRFGFLIALALLLGACRDPSIVDVIDGDTLRLDGTVLQLAGVVAPDMNSLADCEQEMVLGAAARRHLHQFVREGVRFEATGGRTPSRAFLVHLYTDDGRSVADQLLELGLVARWPGQKPDWCRAPSEQPSDPDAPGPQAKSILP